MQPTNYSHSDIRNCLGQWLFINHIVGLDNQTPNVDDFMNRLAGSTESVTAATALLKQNKIDMDSFATDPAEDDANVCISCQ